MGELILAVVVTVSIGIVIYLATNGKDPGAEYRETANRRLCPMCGAERGEGVTQCECGYVYQTVMTSDPAPVATPSPSVREDRAPGEGWTIWGWLLAIGGLVGLAISLSMKMSVETYTPSSILGPGGSSDVVNLGLMFNKGVAVACSLSAIGLGVFCFAVAAILKAIGR